MATPRGLIRRLGPLKAGKVGGHYKTQSFIVQAPCGTGGSSGAVSIFPLFPLFSSYFPSTLVPLSNPR